jgi:hypothetical protein
MAYAPCDGCPDCKTTFASHPDFHNELKPHAFRPVYDRYTGAKTDEECRSCMASKNRIDADELARVTAERAWLEAKAAEDADRTTAYRELIDRLSHSGRYEQSPVCGPHCDSLVLHAPGTCEHCDTFPEAQAYRVEHKINFTGEDKPGFAPCFAERRRSADTINKWSGNRALTTRDQE